MVAALRMPQRPLLKSPLRQEIFFCSRTPARADGNQRANLCDRSAERGKQRLDCVPDR